MPALRCSAVRCIYNKEELCSKGDIHVSGAQARTVDETCCDSFRQNVGDVNEYHTGSGYETIDVGCSACNCEFNEERYCIARAIDISGSEAGTSEETCCSTFRRE